MAREVHPPKKLPAQRKPRSGYRTPVQRPPASMSGGAAEQGEFSTATSTSYRLRGRASALGVWKDELGTGDEGASSPLFQPDPFKRRLTAIPFKPAVIPSIAPRIPETAGRKKRNIPRTPFPEPEDIEELRGVKKEDETCPLCPRKLTAEDMPKGYAAHFEEYHPKEHEELMRHQEEDLFGDDEHFGEPWQYESEKPAKPAKEFARRFLTKEGGTSYASGKPWDPSHHKGKGYFVGLKAWEEHERGAAHKSGLLEGWWRDPDSGERTGDLVAHVADRTEAHALAAAAHQRAIYNIETGQDEKTEGGPRTGQSPLKNIAAAQDLLRAVATHRPSWHPTEKGDILSFVRRMFPGQPAEPHQESLVARKVPKDDLAEEEEALRGYKHEAAVVEAAQVAAPFSVTPPQKPKVRTTFSKDEQKGPHRHAWLPESREGKSFYASTEEERRGWPFECIGCGARSDDIVTRFRAGEEPAFKVRTERGARPEEAAPEKFLRRYMKKAHERCDAPGCILRAGHRPEAPFQHVTAEDIEDDPFFVRLNIHPEAMEEIKMQRFLRQRQAPPYVAKDEDEDRPPPKVILPKKGEPITLEGDYAEPKTPEEMREESEMRRTRRGEIEEPSVRAAVIRFRPGEGPYTEGGVEALRERQSKLIQRLGLTKAIEKAAFPPRVQHDLDRAKDPTQIESVLRRHYETLGRPNNAEYAKLMSDIMTERKMPHQILRGHAGEDLTWVHALGTRTHHAPGIDEKRSQRFGKRPLYGARTAMVLHKFPESQQPAKRTLHVDPGEEAHERIERMRAAQTLQESVRQGGRDFRGPRVGPFTEKDFESIEKMALVHDDPTQPKLVYRVQNKRGEGPYWSDYGEKYFGGRSFRTEHSGQTFTSGQATREGRASKRRPSIPADFEHEESRYGRKFGFESPEHAINWFGYKRMEHMYEHGFEIVPVKARRVWSGRSGKQIIYEPHEETEKGLVPRKVEETLAGLSSAERAFYIGLAGLFGGILIQQLGQKLSRQLTEGDTIQRVRDAIDELDDQTNKAAADHVDNVWTLAIKDAANTWPRARREERDYAMSQNLMSFPTGLVPSIHGLNDEVRLELEKIVRDAYFDPRGFDFPAMMNQMSAAVDIKKSRLEMIARTSTSSIANLARVVQIQKYGEAGELVDWIVANHPRGDARTCEICKAIANGGAAGMKSYHGNPYTVKELEDLVPHLVAHPNERCTVVRKVI